MALPIKPTPELQGKSTKQFIKRMKEIEQSKPTDISPPDISKASMKLKSNS